MNAQRLSASRISFANFRRAKVPHMPGMYILYPSNIGGGAYVGRSDVSLFNDLASVRRNGTYRYFKFLPCRSAEEAWQWECLFWHKQGESGEPHNRPHPRRPMGAVAQCPYPGCDHVEQDHVHVEDEPVQAIYDAGEFADPSAEPAPEPRSDGEA